MFWVQRAHGRRGTKLCNYIAADRMNYQYVCYETFQIGGPKEDFAIKNIGMFIDITIDYDMVLRHKVRNNSWPHSTHQRGHVTLLVHQSRDNKLERWI